MFNFEVFESDDLSGRGSVLIVCRGADAPAAAVLHISKPTWRHLKSDDALLSEVMRVALKLGGETLLQLRQQLDHEHHCRGRFSISDLEYRQKSGTKVKQQGETLPFLIRLYKDSISRGITNTERRMSALCGSEIVVNAAWPGYVLLYELSLIYGEFAAA